MAILYSSRFGREYKKLPEEIKKAAETKEKIFRKNPFDSGLKTHKLNGELDGFWSFWVTYSYRIVFDFVDEKTVRFYRIGTHDVYG